MRFRPAGFSVSHNKVSQMLQVAKDTIQFLTGGVVNHVLTLPNFIMSGDHPVVESMKAQAREKFLKQEKSQEGADVDVDEEGEDDEGVRERGFGWVSKHRKEWSDNLGVRDWQPHPSRDIPPQYADNWVFKSLCDRDRDIILYWDEKSPIDSDMKEEYKKNSVDVGIDLLSS